MAAFTSGTISRESPIRVAFHEAVARPEQVGAPLDASPFRFEPRIEGTAVWAAPDRIEFRPAERLPDGQTYSASLDLAPLLPAGKTPLARFDFVFSTMRQSFDVAVDGLQAADATDVKRQALTGRLVTADVEEAPGVEKVLRASFAGRELPVAWTHESNRRVHAFTVGGIERAEAASALRLSWDGGPIGVDRKEAREIAVPGLDTFTVDQARVVVAPEPHVELRFTDPLKPGQNLKGLVRIGDRDDLRFVADGSRLEVYGTKGWRGEQTVRVEAGVRNVLGYRMKEARELTVQFELLKPAVRFAGKGVIVPTSAGFTIPIEAVNLRAVTVEALQVPSSNMPQFLQVERPRRRAGAAARGPGRLEEDAVARPDRGQGEPLASRGARRVAAPREEPGRDVPAHAVLPPAARRLALRGGGGRAEAERAGGQRRTTSRSRATGTRGRRTRGATGTSASRTATTPATPPTTSASTTTTSAPRATCSSPTSA